MESKTRSSSNGGPGPQAPAGRHAEGVHSHDGRALALKISVKEPQRRQRFPASRQIRPPYRPDDIARRDLPCALQEGSISAYLRLAPSLVAQGSRPVGEDFGNTDDAADDGDDGPERIFWGVSALLRREFHRAPSGSHYNAAAGKVSGIFPAMPSKTELAAPAGRRRDSAQPGGAGCEPAAGSIPARRGASRAGRV